MYIRSHPSDRYRKGYRHEVFLIARVRPDGAATPRYHCIAGFRHRYCYGLLALNAIHSFITQLKQSAHSEIIRAEIAAIQTKWEGLRLPAYPCPYATFLLGTNWPVDGFYFTASVLEAGTSSGVGSSANDAGISVIDVTDPTCPSYCFVSIGSMEAAKTATPSWVPLSAATYARAYYPEYIPVSKPPSEETKEEADKRLFEEEVQATIALLKDVKLIDYKILAEAWPKEYVKSLGEVQHTEKNLGPQVSDSSLHVTPRRVLSTPGKIFDVKAILRNQSSFSENGLMLLAQVIETEVQVDGTTVDLSGFSLSSAQIETLISAINIGIETLNLSYISGVTVNTIRVVLEVHPQLKRLVLLGCQSISKKEIWDLLRTEPKLFYHLEALIHPGLLEALHDTSDKSPYPNAFSYIGYHDNILKACSLPFYTPSRVVQALTDLLQPCNTPENAFIQSSLPMHAAFSSIHAPDQAWKDRSVVIIPQLSLKATKGEGWAFVHRTNGYYSPSRPAPIPRGYSTGHNGTYAFIRSKSSLPVASKWVLPEMEIHDLASFIDQMVLDERPHVAKDAVDKLQAILVAHNMTLMTSNKEVQTFIQDVTMASTRSL